MVTVAVAALYFGLQISLFIFGGFGVFYILIYAMRRILLYDKWKKLFNPTNNNGENDEKDGLIDDDILGQPKDKNYITVFFFFFYIAVIVYLFESAAIVFTAFYFSLQISLFVFIGFSLLYTLIYAAREIVNYCVEPKISTYTELDDDSDSASVDLNEEERPLSENNLHEEQNKFQPNNFS